MAEVVTIQFQLDAKGQIKGFKKFENQAKKSGLLAGENFSKGFASSLNVALGIGIAKLFSKSIDVINKTINSVVQNAQKLGVIETQFKTILGSSAAAQKQLEDLQNFAATTPFQLEGLSEATRQLLSFGVASQDVIPTLRQLGDLAAGAGAGITDLTIPFGRLVSTQKLTLQELDKFADRGINIYGELAKQTGKSLASIRTDISKGTIPFKEFEKALENLTSKGGTFFNATTALSKTFAGTVSTLDDNIFNLTANLGKAFSPFIIKTVTKLTQVVAQLSKETKGLNAFSDVIEPILLFNQAFIDFVIAPFELLGNVAKASIDNVKLLFQGYIATLGTVGEAFAEFVGKFGVDNELTKGLKVFGESSRETFEDFSKNSKDSLQSVLDFPLSEGLAEKNQAVLESFRAVSDQQQTELALLTQGQKQALADAAEAAKVTAETSGGFFSSLNVSFKTSSKQIIASSKQLTQQFKGGLVKGISGGIQTIISSVAAGENAFKAFGKFILTTVGDLAIQLGNTLIGAGIGIESLKSLKGGAAIAAGAGLVALGSILKSFTGSGAGSSGAPSTGGGTGSSAPIDSFDSATLSEPDDIEERSTGPKVQLIVQGDILDSDQTSNRILDLLNKNFDDDAGALNNASFA
jgi:hypothetical protein